MKRANNFSLNTEQDSHIIPDIADMWSMIDLSFWILEQSKKRFYQQWPKQRVVKETFKHINFIARSSCCVSCFELFMGLQGRAGERPLYRNNPTASRRCDIDNKVHTLPLWVPLTANPPSPLQHTYAHTPHICMHAHGHTCQIVALAISPLPCRLSPGEKEGA